ncbi:MAG: bifunctional phosphoribosylaminoimidazolecarboxamide formyltransferase/IMP cyclohydrolase, partial [Nitrospinota bacterium]|nr:bifunctional phosphoribosylaminoimidazolecarboxamide formyltransferase/IMP cyclohydrolase [Nitrospinota bacterium]
SVSDKTGIIDLARELSGLGVEILSTGGTAKAIREAGVDVRDVGDYTGFPEIMDGRVKTLHPKVHGGLLGRRDIPAHMEQMKEHGIEPIGMVVVNLYPFEETVAKQGTSFDEAIENIDIGGPSMIRSAAKNHRDVAVVVDPEDYSAIIAELKESGRTLSDKTRLTLATKAFERTTWYDGVIADYLSSTSSHHEKFPKKLTIRLQKTQALRYGENPHQEAALYTPVGSRRHSAEIEQLHGKELSFNNIVDLNAAYELACEFADPAVAIIKHTNPCGVAINQSLVKAYQAALECDPVSAFGGVIAINRDLDEETAEEISKLFVEVVIAPAYSRSALEKLTSKKNVRLIRNTARKPDNALAFKLLSGAALVQDDDLKTLDETLLKVVSSRQPTQSEMDAMKFAWIVAKHVKSNAIVYADANSTIGIGAGQMSRVDSARIAREKARRPVEGAVMASDAFFPFRDGIDEAAQAKITAVIQPGGSVRDEEVIAAANEHGMAMVFTGLRHFRH